MQHKRGTFFQFKGEAVEIRDYAMLKMENSHRNQEIRISQIGMASKRIADDYPELAAWFCLNTPDRREFLVEEALKKEGVDAFVPTRKGEKILKRHRIIDAPLLPILPSYVLVRCVPSASAMAGLRRFQCQDRRSIKVIGIVGSGLKPYPIPAKFMNKFMEKAAAGAYDHRAPEPTEYVVGQAVKVTDGPFASFPGSVVDFDGERNRVKVEVLIFGRETPVELDVAQIEKV